MTCFLVGDWLVGGFWQFNFYRVGTADSIKRGLLKMLGIFSITNFYFSLNFACTRVRGLYDPHMTLMRQSYDLIRYIIWPSYDPLWYLIWPFLQGSYDPLKKRYYSKQVIWPVWNTLDDTSYDPHMTLMRPSYDPHMTPYDTSYDPYMTPIWDHHMTHMIPSYDPR